MAILPVLLAAFSHSTFIKTPESAVFLLASDWTGS